MSCRGFFLSALLVAVLSAPSADARDRRKERGQVEPHGLSDRRHDDRPSPAAVAAEMAVRANGGGRVLSVDRADGGYRVKVLKDGEVRTHQITLE